MMFIFSIFGIALVIVTTVQLMKRTNSRVAAILLGTPMAPVPTIAGAALMWSAAPGEALRTGGAFAIAMSALFLAGLTLAIGAVIAIAIAFSMKERDPEEVYLDNLEDDPGGRR